MDALVRNAASSLTPQHELANAMPVPTAVYCHETAIQSEISGDVGF